VDTLIYAQFQNLQVVLQETYVLIFWVGITALIYEKCRKDNLSLWLMAPYVYLQHAGMFKQINTLANEL